MTTLVTGGSKCGKSRLAESILDRASDRKFYIATMEPYGDEAFAAIARHREIRAGKGFVTVEKYTCLHELDLPEGSHILLECLGNLCANEMFGGGEVSDPTERIMRGIIHLKSRAETLVIVTNNVGSDGVSYDAGTMRYIEAMGRLNAGIAAISDRVAECVYGIPTALKGEPFGKPVKGENGMILITGGAFQGKREYAKSRFGLSDGDITDGGSAKLSAVAEARCVCGYELAVKRMLAEGTDPLAFTSELKADIVIMNEIGSGIIPLERSEREWREMTGRAGCILAEKADSVFRVCCGIAAEIKGESS